MSSREVFSHCFFKYSFWTVLCFLSVWKPHCTYIGVLDGFPQVSQALFIFLHSFVFWFFRLGNVNWLIFKFADSSAYSNLLSLSNENFISVIIPFKSRIYIFFIIFISIGTIYWDIILLVFLIFFFFSLFFFPDIFHFSKSLGFLKFFYRVIKGLVNW